MLVPAWSNECSSPLASTPISGYVGSITTTTTTTTAPSFEQTQDILMNASHRTSCSQYQKPTPTPTPTPTPSHSPTSSQGHSHHSHPLEYTHPVPPSHVRQRPFQQETPTIRPVLTVQASPGMKQCTKGRRASATGVKSPSSCVSRPLVS
jgi:hypothetical protein